MRDEKAVFFGVASKPLLLPRRGVTASVPPPPPPPSLAFPTLGDRLRIVNGMGGAKLKLSSVTHDIKEAD